MRLYLLAVDRMCVIWLPHARSIELSLVAAQCIGILFVVLGVPAIPPPPYFIAQIVALALIVVGVYYFFTSTAMLAGSLSIMPTPGPGTVLINYGVFGHCRHPLYFGLMTFALGVSLLTLSFNRLFWTVVLMIALDKKADLEEACLLDTFPAYADYAQVLTPALSEPTGSPLEARTKPARCSRHARALTPAQARPKFIPGRLVPLATMPSPTASVGSREGFVVLEDPGTVAE